MRRIAYQERKLPLSRGVVRRGLTLIEVAVVISVGALLTGIAITTLAAMLHADRELSSRAARRPQLTAIAAEMRRDIAQAEDVAWNEDKELLELSLPNNAKLRYRQLPDRWERRAFNDDRVSDSGGKLTRALPTPRRLACRVEPAEATAGDLVRILFSTRGRNRAEQARQPVLEIAAVAGRDRRLLQE